MVKQKDNIINFDPVGEQEAEIIEWYRYRVKTEQTLDQFCIVLKKFKLTCDRHFPYIP